MDINPFRTVNYGKIHSIYSSNSEAFASELLEYIEELFA